MKTVKRRTFIKVWDRMLFVGQIKKVSALEAFKMARLAGFEPATTWFEARYSIQLSYSRSRYFLEVV